MSQPPAMTVATRRALVRQLIKDDATLSARAIAGQIGVSKDTVRRDLEALRQAQPPAEPPVEPTEPADAPLVQHDAPHDPLDDSVRDWLTPAAHNDLYVLVEAGHTPDYAVRRALEVLAHIYRGAWQRGDYPRGIPPSIRSVSLHPYDPEKDPT